MDFEVCFLLYFGVRYVVERGGLCFRYVSVCLSYVYRFITVFTVYKDVRYV